MGDGLLNGMRESPEGCLDRESPVGEFKLIEPRLKPKACEFVDVDERYPERGEDDAVLGECKEDGPPGDGPRKDDRSISCKICCCCMGESPINGPCC